jgi:ribosomal protein S18 acetylase RimI-like enzyme
MVQALRVFESASAFLDAYGAWLGEREAEHNVLLGVAGWVARASEPERAFFAGIEDDAGRPLLAMLATPPHRVVLSHVEPGLDREDAARAVVAALAGRWQPGGVLGEIDLGSAIATEWQRVTGQRSRPAARELIYELTIVRPPSGIPGRLRPIEPADRELLLDWMVGFGRDALHEDSTRESHAAHVDWRLAADPPSAFVWDDGGAVSMAFATGPTPHGIRINAVYTPPERRGRGYARACCAALSARLLAEGRDSVFLYADADYPTSNFVYQSIGFERIAEVQEIDFVSGAPAAPPVTGR